MPLKVVKAIPQRRRWILRRLSIVSQRTSFSDEMDVQNYLVSGWTDRALLDLRLSGAAKPLVDSLRDIYHKMLVSGSDYDSANLVRILSILDTLCQDYDFSTDFATFGGHMLLKKLLNADHTDSDVTDAIENVVCSISTSGCAFPLKNIVTNNSAESIVKPTICRFSQGQQSSFQSKDDVNSMVTESHCDSANSNEFAVYLRSIPVSMYGTGQHAVGYLLWSSAVILSRFLVSNEALLLREQSVLECGAGLGLCGIVAGKYAKAVTISDFNEILAQNLVYNISKSFFYNIHFGILVMHSLIHSFSLSLVHFFFKNLKLPASP